MAKRGLGRGLDVLIGSAAEKESRRMDEIPVKDIRPNPRQPRRSFDQESLHEMARSIEAFGVMQPVIVRPVGTEYELIAGERRWRAAREVGLEKIPALIRESSETGSLEMALVENIHRDNLNGIEEAAAYQQLLEDFGITHEELSNRVGKSRVAITNTLRLLQLPVEIQKSVAENSITTGHARALLMLQEEPELQDKLAARISGEGLSVRQAEELARSFKEGGGRARRQRAPLPDEAVAMFGLFEELLETRVKGAIGKRKGRLVVEFKDLDDLRRIYEVIASQRSPKQAGA